MIGLFWTMAESLSAFRLYRPGDMNHHSRSPCPIALPRSRKNTLAAETRIAEASENTYWTAAISGIQIDKTIAIAPELVVIGGDFFHNVKPTTPAVTVATGSTSLGNAICLISFSCRITDVVASVMTAWYHFHGRIAAKMNSG